MIQILDSKYKKANFKSVVQGGKHMTNVEKELLYTLLVQYDLMVL